MGAVQCRDILPCSTEGNVSFSPTYCGSPRCGEYDIGAHITMDEHHGASVEGGSSCECRSKKGRADTVYRDFEEETVNSTMSGTQSPTNSEHLSMSSPTYWLEGAEVELFPSPITKKQHNNSSVTKNEAAAAHTGMNPVDVLEAERQEMKQILEGLMSRRKRARGGVVDASSQAKEEVIVSRSRTSRTTEQGPNDDATVREVSVGTTKKDTGRKSTTAAPPAGLPPQVAQARRAMEANDKMRGKKIDASRVAVGRTVEAQRDEAHIAAAERKHRQLLEQVQEERDVVGLTAETREFYERGLQKTLEFPEPWTIGFESETTKIAYEYVPGQSYVWTHARVLIRNASVQEVIAGCSELSEWPTWHPTVWRIESVGPRTATGHGCRADNSVAFGLVKFDVSSKLHRFIGPGYVLEALVDAKEGDDAYAAPVEGVRRGGVESYTMFVPTPNGVMIIQHAKIDLQMALPTWTIRWVMNSFTPKLVQNFQTLMDVVQSDKKAFKGLMKRDVTGLYALLKERQENKASKNNDLVKDGGRDSSRGLKRMFEKIYVSSSHSLGSFANKLAKTKSSSKA